MVDSLAAGKEEEGYSTTFHKGKDDAPGAKMDVVVEEKAGEIGFETV